MALNLTRENRLSNAYLVEIDNMNTKLDDFYILLDQKADPASDLRLTGIEDRLDIVEDALTTHQGYIDQLSDESDAVNTRVDGVDGLIVNIGTRIDGIDTNIVNIGTRIDGVETDYAAADTALLATVAGTVATANGRIDTVVSRVNQHDIDMLGFFSEGARITTVEGRLDGVDTLITDIDTRIDDVDTAIDTTNANLSLVDARVDDVNDRIDGVDTAIAGIGTRADTNDTRIDGIDGQINIINTDFMDVNDRCNAIETAYVLADGAVRATYDVHVNRIDGNVATLSGRVTTVEGVAAQNATDINGINALLGQQFHDDATSVTYWGAVGDGVTNDTVAIQNCIANNNSNIFFPFGTYLIRGDLVITTKPDDFTLKSQNATILCDQALFVGSKCLSVISCKNFTIDGDLTIATNSTLDITPAGVLPALKDAFYIQQCENGYFDNITIVGPFEKGFNCGANVPLTPTTINNLNVSNCKLGVKMAGEYYMINTSQITTCRVGIEITGGNNNVVTSVINLNRVGIFVKGNNSNSDHGKIGTNTINHNTVAGVLIKDTKFSMQLTSNQIWATIGNYTGPNWLPNTLSTDVASPTGDLTTCGVYIQNSENVNMVANTLGNNTYNLGLDGVICSSITSNSFLSDITRTISHIEFFGTYHNQYIRNTQLSICCNSFYQDFYNRTGEHKAIKFKKNTGQSSRDDCYITCKNNVRLVELLSSVPTGGYALMLNTVGTAETRIFDPNHEYLLYDVASLATVQLSSSWAGQNFEVYITGITGGQTRTMQLETNATYDGARTPVFIRSGIAYNTGTKTYTFSENGAYKFVSLGTDINSYRVF
jgi:hypothetical protein